MIRVMMYLYSHAYIEREAFHCGSGYLAQVFTHHHSQSMCRGQTGIYILMNNYKS